MPAFEDVRGGRVHEHRETSDVATIPIDTAESLVDTFATMARFLGADVATADVSTVIDTVTRLAGESAAISSDVLRHYPELRSVEAREGGAWLTAVSLAQAGVAATGSVLIAETEEGERIFPILAQRHVVLVPAGSIVPSLAGAVPLLRALYIAGVRYATFVSGPSRTADIEKRIVLGVHGPREIHVAAVWHGHD